VGKTAVVYVTFLHDVACQKLLKSANVSRSYSKNNTGTVFFETRCSTNKQKAGANGISEQKPQEHS